MMGVTSRSPFRSYTDATRHFVSTRGVEVVALQASPILGSYLGGFRIEPHDVVKLALMLLGSFALTAHVFVLNDWAGHGSDTRDPRRAKSAPARRGISSRRVARVAIALLILASFAFALPGGETMLWGAAIASLSLLYSCSPRFGKGTPIIPSINHLFGGALHFLLGYTLFHSLDSRGFVISMFFGLVFAAGHLNQEIRDYEGDLLNGIRTNAVAFGSRRTFVASMCIFSSAYAALVGLSVIGFLPRAMFWSFLVWILHVAWARRAWQRGLGFETAIWMQRRYRLLFAVIGLAMLVR